MKNYDNFFFPSDNFDDSKEFYSKILGLSLKFDFSDHGMIAFKVGEEEPAIIIKDRSKFPNAKPALWIEVEDVQSLYPEMKDKGVKFLTEPFRIKTGWAVEFTDPSGNILGITDYKNE
jgi:predicted enzyme related to lactoylglutathione lyase